MRLNKKTILCMTFMWGLSTLCIDAKTPSIHAHGAVVIEKESGRMLYGKEEEVPRAMASTTKIMTCIIALEKGDLEDVVITSKKASRAPKVKLYLKEGEKQRLGDLLYSLMLESHNDSAVAIAEHIGGDVESFCQMMTEKAKAMGAKNTSFETPNGLDGEKHYASPKDMALITAYAMDNPEFMKIINTPQMTIPRKPLEGSKVHHLQNKNRFLSMYEGACGVKTGFTSKAGHCFVGAAKKENMTCIGVALGSGCAGVGRTRKYTDVVKILNEAYKNYDLYEAQADELLTEISVDKGKKETVRVKGKESIRLPLTETEVDQIKWYIVCPKTLKAPVTQNRWIGRAHLVLGNDILETVDLFTTEGVCKSTLWDQFKKWIENKMK